MKFAVIGGLLGALVWSGGAGAQAFDTITLFEACLDRRQDSPVNHLCQGYMRGFYESVVMGEAANELRGVAPALCLPNTVSMLDVRENFLNWVRAHPEDAKARPGLSMYAALIAQYSCKAS